MAATVDLAILLHSLNHPRIPSGRRRNYPLLTALLGLERLTMNNDPDLCAATEASLREANAPKAQFPQVPRLIVPVVDGTDD